MEYVGEHLLPGKIGHFALLLGFVTSLMAALSYYFATERRNADQYEPWLNIGRGGFIVHSISMLSVIGLLFYMMINKFYEYQYVQAHVSDDLPFKFIFSAFWEGQEGSFLLWMFWHIILGLFLMVTAKKWEAPVLSVLSLIQAFIGSMLLGVFVGWGDTPVKIGSNPFLLLRDTIEAPIFANADYLELISGTGINTLLQNYWMTIHPPTLFLGFASTAVPFAFAIAGLWTKEHKAWLKPALPWALFSGSILGLGILMGGAWAYEALSFGGYWAWDPVENTSLVPWIVIIAGIHTNLIAKSTGRAIKSTYIYYLLTFLLIVYSTTLTRSGVLGETSVHAFTEMGLEWQLVAFISAFTILSFVLLILQNRSIPTVDKEEATASKEFWMFIGSLVLLFSALIITGSTSLPVYNKFMQYFDPDFQGLTITDPIPHYNRYQIWIAVFIGLLSGASQYLRYQALNWQKKYNSFLTRIAVSLFLTFGLTYLTTLWIQTGQWQYWILLFAGIFTVVTNLDYAIFFLRGNLKKGASALAHIGFGLMIVGIIASGLNQRFVSSNPFLMSGIMADESDEEFSKKNIMLTKGIEMPMHPYAVTYVSDTLETFNRTYTVNFKKRNKNGEVVEDFNLYPNIIYNKTFTKIEVPNPSTRRYWNKDIFTVINALPESEQNFEARRSRDSLLNYRPVELPLNAPVEILDTVKLRDIEEQRIRRYQVFLRGINRSPSHPDYEPESGDLALSAIVEVVGPNADTSFIAEPLIALRGQLLYSYPAQINEINTKVKLDEKIFERVFTQEERLDYQSFELKQGDEFVFEGNRISFGGFNKNPQQPGYQKQPGDIAVSAILQVMGSNGNNYLTEPIYYIRGNRPLNVKSELSDLNLHFRFTNLDPAKESIQLLLAQSDQGQLMAPIEFATNSYRSDWIVLQAIEFPGINLFWGGSLLMLFGLAIGMANRIVEKTKQSVEI